MQAPGRGSRQRHTKCLRNTRVSPKEEGRRFPAGISSYVGRRDALRPLVLVIDDGPEARDMYCACLEFHGFRTEAAEDGLSGLAMARSTAPDVVVLDFSMPKMDGIEVLRELRSDARTRVIPVVMVTAIPELIDRRERARCDAFLAKPCDPDVLVQTISNIALGRATRLVARKPRSGRA